MRVAVIGTGYVGLVTGACLAEAGHAVVCVDRDPTRVTAIASGRTPSTKPACPNWSPAMSPLGGCRPASTSRTQSPTLNCP